MLIDCPPGMTPLTMNALVAAGSVLVPTQLDFLSVAGLAVLTETVEEVREYDNPGLRYLGIVGTQADERTRHAREIRDQLEQLFGERAGGVLCRTTIRQSTRVRDAHAAGLAVGQFDPEHPVSADYRALAEELAVRARLELATGSGAMSATRRADAGAAVAGLFAQQLGDRRPRPPRARPSRARRRGAGRLRAALAPGRRADEARRRVPAQPLAARRGPGSRARWAASSSPPACSPRRSSCCAQVDIDMDGVEAGDLAEMTARAREALLRAALEREARVSE